MSKKESLKEIRARRKELLEKERELKKEMDANKKERVEAQKTVKEKKIKFETARKAHSENMKKLNKIHLAKSAVKNFDQFKEAAGNLMLSCESASEALGEYVKSLETLKEYGG